MRQPTCPITAGPVAPGTIVGPPAGPADRADRGPPVGPIAHPPVGTAPVVVERPVPTLAWR